MIARIINLYEKSNVWAEKNPILGKGEMGVESDTNLSKLGDGITHWNDLDYAGARKEDQKYFFQSLANIPRESVAENLRGLLAFVYIGPTGNRTDRAFMYLNKTIDGVTTCELVPISYFASIRDQVESEIG